MKPIVLGASNEWGHKAVELDVERLLVTRLLVQANSGGGKSWALRRLLEQMFGAMPHVVIDIDGEFVTLREKFAYVLASAGAGGDCRIDARTAELLARRVLEHGFSVIVDLSEMKKPARAHFVRLFLEALIESPRALWRPLLVVVDEAHLFCPEKNQAESTSAVIDLLTRGRKRGFCGVLATQRISKLNKDAAAECNNKLIGRSALDVDMKRASDELGFTSREQQQGLRALDEGQFYAFGPAISKTVTLLKMGGIETTHPEPGKGGKVAPPPAPAKLAQILEKLADLPAEAEAEAGEIERLRREVRELRARDAGGVMDQAVEIGANRQEASEQGRKEGMAAGWRRALEAVKPIADRLAMLGETLGEEIPLFRRELEQILAGAPAAPPARQEPKAATAPPAPRAAARTGTASCAVSAPQQRILDALAWLESVGEVDTPKVRLALLAGQSPKSSGYQNNLGFLRSAGLIDYPFGGHVRLTHDGRGAAQAPGRAPTIDDLHRTLEERLPAPQWRILEHLIRQYPQPLSRIGVASSAGQSDSSSGYQNNLGALRSLGFIDYPRPGYVVAQPVLFLEHR